MANYRRRNDVILIGGLLVLCAVAFLVVAVHSHRGETVVVTVDGDVLGEYPLREDASIPINATDGHVENLVVIKDGVVHMEEADCPDGLCIHQGNISKTNESIVCLPHRVVVTIRGGREGELDSMAR